MNQRKQLLLAYLCTLTFSSSQMILYAIIPYLAEVSGVQISNIILAISIGSFFFAFMSPFWAARSDVAGRKSILSLSVLGMLISFACIALVFLFTDQLSLAVKTGLIFLSRIIYGCFCSALVPVSQALQLDLIPNLERIKVLTRNSMCLNLGRILGPVLILVKKVNFEKLIFMANAWIFFLLVMVLWNLKNYKTQSQKINFNFKQTFNQWKLSAQESLSPILLALVFSSFIGVIHSFLGHHLKTTLNIAGEEASLLFAKIILFISIFAVIIQWASIKLMKQKLIPRIILGSSSLIIGTVLMILATNLQGIWIAVSILAFATALIPPVYLTLTGKTKLQQVNGQKLGLASIAHSLGNALGMGLIAIALKMHFIPVSFVFFFISICIALISQRIIKNLLGDGTNYQGILNASN